jgi:hypothetical protein
MRFCHTFGLLIACTMMSGCTVPPVPPKAQVPLPTDTPVAQVPRFATAADSDGNELTVSAAGETTLIDVHSQSGIGSASVELVSGVPPRNIVLRLHLQGLEQFRLSYDGTVVTASVAGNDIDSLTESATLSEGGERPITPDSPLWLDVRIVSGQAAPQTPLDQRHFEIRLPKDLLHDGRRSFSIRWIDFYR